MAENSKTIDYEINFKTNASLEKFYDNIKKINIYLKKNKETMEVVTKNLTAQARLLEAQNEKLKIKLKLNKENSKELEKQKKQEEESHRRQMRRDKEIIDKIDKRSKLQKFIDGGKKGISPIKSVISGSIYGAYSNSYSTVYDYIYKKKTKNLKEPNQENYKNDAEGYKEAYGQYSENVASIGMAAAKKAGWIGVVIAIVAGIVKAYKTSIESWSTILGINLNIKSVWQDILKETSQSLSNMQTANFATSIFTNSKARQQQLSLGLSGSQNYALTQTMSMLGMSSLNDVFYMNNTQRDIFTTYMSKFSSLYDKLNNSGAIQATQELKLAFAAFKIEIGNKLLNWLSNNKDRIIRLMDSLLFFVDTVLEILSGITKTANISLGSGGYISNKYVNINTTNNISGTNSEITTSVNDGVDSLAKAVKLELGV